SIPVDDPTAMAVAAAATGLVAALLVPLLQQAIETRVHQAIFARRYDYRIRLRQLGADLVHILDERELIQRLAGTLASILELESCAVYLRDERSRQLVQQYPAANDVLDGPGLAALEGITEPVLTEELRAARSPAAPLLIARAYEVTLPLRVN